MDFRETTKIMSVIKQTYQSFNKGVPLKELDGTIKIWQSIFEDYTYTEVALGLKSFIANDTKGFAPVPGQIIDYIQKLKSPVCIDADKAWNLVFKALGDSIHNSKAEFDKLPPEVQAGIGSHEQLRTWATMNTDELQTVVASNFKRGYTTRVKEIKEYEKLPTQARYMIDQLVEAKRIGLEKSQPNELPSWYHDQSNIKIDTEDFNEAEMIELQNQLRGGR